MSDPSDMNIAVRVTAFKFEQLKREASRKGITVSEYAGQLMHGRDAQPGVAQPPSFEDVRLMIREEIRAALCEMWRTPADGSHTMSISDPRLVVMPGWYAER